MNRIWLVMAVLLLAGCGIQPAGVTDGPDAPTGVAAGVTLYFVDAHKELRPQLRQTHQLGTIADALSLLLTGPGDADRHLHTEIARDATQRVSVTYTPDTIQLLVPLTSREVTPLGIDQIVCTALGVHVQGGGSRSTKVQLLFTQPTPESDKTRTCPLIRAW
nr:hypothetical protein [Kibdelosporangium sp. MJ126-NF4]CEL21028.1 hypothetical protein [Kibdelosporangium sp. MJ126-NF4]CTQ95458.1 hypothetical protein [Kibdelosporangium sp. MJ126-NF4]